MDCKQCVRAGAYLDGVMSSKDREQFEAHVAICPECSREVAQLTRLSRFVCAAELPKSADLTQKFRLRRKSQKLLVRFATMLTAAAAAIIVVSGLSLVLHPTDSGPVTMSWEHLAVTQQTEPLPQADPDDPIAQVLLQEKP